jgi:hypothetical protein
MSSNLSKIRSIIQHFKIKYDIKADLKNQPYVLDQLARILNIKLESKLSFEKKLSKILKAFNEYSKKRQLFDQSESINKPRERTGEKTGVPEAQKFIIPPHAFQSNQNKDQLSLFADKQIESLKDLITETQLELSTDIKSSRSVEVAKFAKKFDALELSSRNQAKEEMTESDYERYREAKDLHLPNNFEDLSPIVQGWIKWTREDIDDYEFFDSIDKENDATLPSAFESKGVQVDADTFEADTFAKKYTVEENQPQLPIHMRPINGNTMIPMNPMVYSMYPRPVRSSAGEIALNDFMDEEADDESEPFSEDMDENVDEE